MGSARGRLISLRTVAAVAAVAAALCGVGCGGTSSNVGVSSKSASTQKPVVSSVPKSAGRQLTNCDSLRAAIDETNAQWPVLCPFNVPTGTKKVGFTGIGPYGSVGAGYMAEGYDPDEVNEDSPSIWTVSVSRSAALRENVQYGSHRERIVVAGQPITRYWAPRMSEMPGVQAGHVVLVWTGSRGGCRVSARGYANEAVARSLMSDVLSACVRDLR